MQSAEIRERFLKFFASKGHEIVPSASLIPYNDPSLLWINAGMAPLKKYFDGSEKPRNPRLTNSQKCIRTNDIENVGKTARHHTFFEMLGNFSIGDYFKREAIHWAWEFLTKEIGFAPERLSVTIHPEDEEAYTIWSKEIGLPDERIVRLEDNFWDIGEGPCGPCSEIFYDRQIEGCTNPDCKAGCDCDRFLEVWNLVFSQYNHNPDGSYTPLPKKNIDTGMGLERMASLLQNGETNFDTDLFLPLIHEVSRLSGKAYHEKKEWDVAMKVIADHIRAVTFAVGDGALPSNEGRGYVIRRLLRRAVRYGKVLGIEKPFLHTLVPIVGQIMGSYYGEVVQKGEFIARVVKAEEERFSETLHEGEQILADVIVSLKREGKSVIPGGEAFRLYDTYGFPIDLTEEMAAEEGFTVDRQGFEEALNEQRERARAARKEFASMHVQSTLFQELGELSSRFVGYSELTAKAQVLALLREGQPVEEAQEGETVDLILDRTPFYAEAGGQVADRGVITVGDKGQLQVLDVQKAPNGTHLHKVKVLAGVVQRLDQVEAAIDAVKRADITRNHTATHLLHKALRDVLGVHVAQAGSLVEADRLRFDFSHIAAMTPEEIREVERRVNEQIWKNQPVIIREMPLEEAKKLGAMALFGEKYGDTVRVVQAGDYSIELCGGCHVRSTGEIGLFKIVSESSIASGVRRIEGVTGRGAYEFVQKQTQLLEEAASKCKAHVQDLPDRIEHLQGMAKELSKEVETLKSKLAAYEAKELLSRAAEADGIRYIAAVLEDLDMDGLRAVAEDLRNRLGSGVVVLGSGGNNKVSFVAAVSKDLVAKGVQAGKIVKQVAAITGGGGGGRPELAQAGGRDVSKLREALEQVPHILRQQAAHA